MPVPSGVSTVQVFVKAPISHGGGVGKVFLEVKPALRLFHIATGTPMVEFTDASAPDQGSMAQVVLPHTDQAGFQDASGAPVTSWHYVARVKYEKDGATVYEPPKFFSLPVGQAQPVDLSLVPAGQPALPTVGPVASALSVNGMTGHVTGLATVTQALLDAARDPEEMFTGVITRDANNAPTDASVEWPDGVTGIYEGTPSGTFPGAIDSYTITYGELTYTQPAVTRNAAGAITNRPAITTA